MSFLEEVKEEIVNLRVKKVCCMASEVRGVLTFGGAVLGENLIYGTDSFHMAKRLSSFLKRVCNIDFADRLSEDAGSYKFLIPKEILSELKLVCTPEGVQQLEDAESESCCMRAYVRGAFLASGSAANPEKAYRVEIFSENENAAEKVFDILKRLNVACKKVKRKKLFVIYANNSETASDILKVAECSSAVFAMLAAKVEKERRNDANRQSNCDLANIERVSENSRREADAIRLIDKKLGIENLKPKLREAAMLRIENEGASLTELCELCDPPLPKSTLKNRLNKLIQIAKELSD